ncbi:alpha-galactosidase [Sphingosinicella sp. LHD-64]|uniref:glycoside hydrolase family 36 protein n=1 Tax=Sphingosinicella sp. LHD-64 TaxID=3072139 RepID=UPI00280E847D|nr:alpha-galactosidase [Sphingosinicella sp. LHD-64]MDQ8757108.1 alpha-galactosidase [Sphingosinicella sp. LHD-64]
MSRSGSAMELDLAALRIRGLGIDLAAIAPLIDGTVPPHHQAEIADDIVIWPLDPGRMVLEIVEGDDGFRLRVRLEGIDPGRAVDSLGLRFGEVRGCRRYLRNGYQSWDGSYFVAPGTPAGDGPPGRAPTLGFAMTALLPEDASGALVLGFTRHDRFQSRFRFGGCAESLSIDMETLRDRVPHDGAIEAEPIVLFQGAAVEESLRAWSRRVAAQSPVPPRLPARRITGWCSWYNLYAAIDERLILEHLAGATAFRDAHGVPLGIFQIDDGFTPEMGDWLDVKPQFPRGMAPLLGDIAAAGFTPGLWIAPFMVGNRSRLFAEHPDWMVKRASDGQPLAQMTFYGEFRWHKRSEEYYILDITHPEAETYIRQVFRTWRRDWGAGYFKTDFMLFGSEHGPETAGWHRPGLSRIAIWRRMAALIREEIGEALWLGCGCPLWASVGLVDAVRIGRDIGVSWTGDYSAESLLRDLQTRNHGNGILWQADPDCILLRDRFHELTDVQVETLARFAGLSGGVLMTSDDLTELSGARQRLFSELLSRPIDRCSFPALEEESDLVIQDIEWSGAVVGTNLVNPAEGPATRNGRILPPFESRYSSAHV